MSHLDILTEDIRWPRKIMCGINASATRGQIVVDSDDLFLKFIKRANLIDCFIQSNSDLNRDSGVLCMLFIDIDNIDSLDSARKQTFIISERVESIFHIKPHVQFSGFKGYHVLIPFTPYPLPGGLYELKVYLRYMQNYLSDGMCDCQILGDSVRLFRVPETYNSKGIIKTGDGYVKVIQEWDGRKADGKTLYEKFKSYESDTLNEKITHPIKSRVETPRQLLTGMRCGISTLIGIAEGGGRLEHRERLAVACELINIGWSDEDIISIFSKQDDYDYYKTSYFINHARRSGYKPFSQNHIDELMVLHE